MELISRSEAKKAGLKHYCEGHPCHRGHVGGRYVSNSACVECTLEDSAKRQAGGARQAYQNSWARRNPEKRREYERKKMVNNRPAYIAKRQRARWKFRGTPAPDRPMPDHCECCGKLETTVRKGSLLCLHLDHCHGSNKFRGWLCNACNLGIGKLGDTVESLERALAYLKRAECPQLPDDSLVEEKWSAK